MVVVVVGGRWLEDGQCRGGEVGGRGRGIVKGAVTIRARVLCEVLRS